MKRLILLIFFIPTMLTAEISIKELENSSQWIKTTRGDVTFYTGKSDGRVPILCFHEIGSESRYQLTADNFERFLIYLNNNNFYPLSDKEFINNDFSQVPTGYIPIVLGSDDASDGNFEYKTIGNSRDGLLDLSTGKTENREDTMVYLLEKYLRPSNGLINFTFYVSFDDLPFRQSGGASTTDEYYRGIPVIKDKLNYLLDNFIVGCHTVTHPITRDTTAEDFKWELNEFYSIMEEYVGDRITLINTLAYPYGCADLNPALRSMISDFKYGDVEISGAFDFDGYFTKTPFHPAFDSFEVSRLGVDNQNIDKVYGFLEGVKLYRPNRVIVVKNREALNGIKVSSDDLILGAEL